MIPTGNAVQHALRQGRHLLARALHSGRSPLALGALLLLGSTWTVAATTNTAPEFTSLGLNATMINEGQTVTLSGSFTDPDPDDSHTLQIYWRDNGQPHNQNEKVHLPPGQLSFSIPHTYAEAGAAHITVNLADRQQPLDANDNIPGVGGGDAQNTPPLQVANVAPSFVEPSITVTKAGGKSGGVVVAGSFTEPVDPVNVSASWGDAPGTLPQSKAAAQCTVNQQAKTFRCEHTYKTSPAASYQIRLMADDGHGPLDGGEDTHTVLVHIP